MGGGGDVLRSLRGERRGNEGKHFLPFTGRGEGTAPSLITRRLQFLPFSLGEGKSVAYMPFRRGEKNCIGEPSEEGGSCTFNSTKKENWELHSSISIASEKKKVTSPHEEGGKKGCQSHHERKGGENHSLKTHDPTLVMCR